MKDIKDMKDKYFFKFGFPWFCMTKKRQKRVKGKNKRGMIAINRLIGWLIGIFILVVAVIIIWILLGKEQGAFDFIENLFRFGK